MPHLLVDVSQIVPGGRRIRLQLGRPLEAGQGVVVPLQPKADEAEERVGEGVRRGEPDAFPVGGGGLMRRCRVVFIPEASMSHSLGVCSVLSIVIVGGPPASAGASFQGARSHRMVAGTTDWRPMRLIASS
jgi:hypothetical protein